MTDRQTVVGDRIVGWFDKRPWRDTVQAVVIRKELDGGETGIALVDGQWLLATNISSGIPKLEVLRKYESLEHALAEAKVLGRG